MHSSINVGGHFDVIVGRQNAADNVGSSLVCRGLEQLLLEHHVTSERSNRLALRRQCQNSGHTSSL